jgi:hypothetical protein
MLESLNAKGKARPKPMKMKITPVSHQGVFTAKANAAALPKNGAEQGVAIMEAMTPLANESQRPPVSSPRLKPGTTNSKTPSPLSPITTMSTVSPAIIAGLVNCMPQPTRSPPALRAITKAAKTMKVTTTPAVYRMPWSRFCAGVASPCSII